jgi:HrpA-like RNA helicase
MLSVESIFHFPAEKRNEVKIARNRFAAPEGDHLTMLAVYEAFKEAEDAKMFCWENFLNHRAMQKVQDVRKQLVEYTSTFSALPSPSEAGGYSRNEAILRCFASAFFMHVAVRQDDRRYHTLKDGKEVVLHPSSSLFGRKQPPPCVVYNELVLTTRHFMRDVSEVQPAWLAELAPLQFVRG